jgi:hypothetical protein
MRNPEILHEEICNNLNKIINLLSRQTEHHWCCGCGHWNGANLSVCAMCGRTPSEAYPPYKELEDK